MQAISWFKQESRTRFNQSLWRNCQRKSLTSAAPTKRKGFGSRSSILFRPRGGHFASSFPLVLISTAWFAITCFLIPMQPDLDAHVGGRAAWPAPCRSDSDIPIARDNDLRMKMKRMYVILVNFGLR